MATNATNGLPVHGLISKIRSIDNIMEPAFDEIWFDRFHAITSRIGETYELLVPLPETLERLRAEFESSGYKKNIPLYPDRADTEQLRNTREELERLRLDMIDNEPNALVRDAYLDAITAADWNAAMIIAGTEADDEMFKKANNALYDYPDESVFKAVCHWIRQDAEKTKESADEYLSKLASDVLSVIPDIHDSHQMLIPTEKDFHAVRQAHMQKGGFYDQLFGSEGMPSEPYIEQIVGDEICLRMLSNIGSDFTVGSSDNNIWAVFPSRKQVVRPKGYRLERDEFIGIVCHEIGSHVLEMVNGSEKKLKLLSTGLAGFEKGNEGRAFLREQIVYENERTFLRQFAWEYIALLHLSVSLGAGLHGEPYNFSRLYHVLYTLYVFWRERRFPRSTNNEAFAHDEAWQLVVRVLKGTNGEGGAYMKDTVYLEGNIRCWQLAAKDPSIILFGDYGKFDITNKDHVKIVQSLL